MMRLRFSVTTAFLLAGLAVAPAQAQQSPVAATPAGPAATANKDHLSYYTYYKSVSGETVSGVAAKFGLAESSLVRMNPYLTQYGASLPPGTLVCVPKEKDKVNTGLLARSERIAAAKVKAEEDEKAATLAAAEAAKSAKSSSGKGNKKKTVETKVETDWPSEAEWDKLAELATKGAPPPPEHSSMVIEAPPSKLITGSGEVVWIPAAKPRVVNKPKRTEDNSRGQLTSRKGKAIHTVIMTGRSFMGVPYVWGGEDPSGFDCSGFIQYVYAKHGIHLPRTADIQFNVGKVVRRGDEKPGDLVFFETYCPGPSHVGIYLGRDYFLHASSSRGVTTDRLSGDFFAQRYLGAKRNF
jgi:cell wall-associated NlpC family hydrolase